MKGGLTGLEGSDIASARAEIHALAQPAYIKDGDLRYVAVNAAYCALANCSEDSLIGGDTANAAAQMFAPERDEKERRTLVFSKDQTAAFSDPADRRQFRLQIRQLTDENGFHYIAGVFEPKRSIRFEGWKAAVPAARHDGQAGRAQAPPPGSGESDVNAVPTDAEQPASTIMRSE